MPVPIDTQFLSGQVRRCAETCGIRLCSQHPKIRLGQALLVGRVHSPCGALAPGGRAEGSNGRQQHVNALRTSDSQSCTRARPASHTWAAQARYGFPLRQLSPTKQQDRGWIRKAYPLSAVHPHSPSHGLHVTPCQHYMMTAQGLPFPGLPTTVIYPPVVSTGCCS